MEKQQNRLDALAALCEQKLLADPDHPRSGRLERDLALYQEARRIGEAVSNRETKGSAQRTGARVSGEQRAEPEKRGERGEER